MNILKKTTRLLRAKKSLAMSTHSWILCHPVFPYYGKSGRGDGDVSESVNCFKVEVEQKKSPSYSQWLAGEMSHSVGEKRKERRDITFINVTSRVVEKAN